MSWVNLERLSKELDCSVVLIDSDALMSTQIIRIYASWIQLCRASETRHGLRMLLLKRKAVSRRDPRYWRGVVDG